MINSIIMTTSMQLAEECLKQQNEEDEEPPAFEGLELFAQTLETVICIFLYFVFLSFYHSHFHDRYLPESK